MMLLEIMVTECADKVLHALMLCACYLCLLVDLPKNSLSVASRQQSREKMLI
jgi:hypothetical protein